MCAYHGIHSSVLKHDLKECFFAMTCPDTLTELKAGISPTPSVCFDGGSLSGWGSVLPWTLQVRRGGNTSPSRSEARDRARPWGSLARFGPAAPPTPHSAMQRRPTGPTAELLSSGSAAHALPCIAATWVQLCLGAPLSVLILRWPREAVDPQDTLGQHPCSGEEEGEEVMWGWLAKRHACSGEGDFVLWPGTLQ